MAEQSCRKRLQDEGSCSICLDYFKDPVTLNCGHNFCQACLANVWRTSSTDATCPRCSETVEAKRPRLNRQLASVVQIAKDLSDLLKNRAVSAEEAAQQCKDQISHSLMILKKEKENILAYKAECEKESSDLLKHMEADREKTAAIFKQMHQSLEEKEKLLVDQSEEMEKEMAKKRDEYLAIISRELSSLDCHMQELEEKQQQSENELLQNLGDVLERCHKELFENLGAFPAELKLRIHDFCDRSPCLDILMKLFEEFFASGLLPKEGTNPDDLLCHWYWCSSNVLHFMTVAKCDVPYSTSDFHNTYRAASAEYQKPKSRGTAKVTLNVDTAHPQLCVSQDCKSVTWTNERQELPDNPERFDGHAFVLGQNGFATGVKTFWEVVVGSGEWAVGIAKKSVRRKGSFEARPEAGIWCMGLWDGEYRFFPSSQDTPLHLNKELKKIRVTLNCASGQVAFFDANTGTKLCEYSYASFSGVASEDVLPEAVLPFFWASQGAQLTLCS